MENKRIEYYRKLLAEYAIDTNNPEEFEDLMTASKERLKNYAINDAIKYMEELKKEQPNN